MGFKKIINEMASFLKWIAIAVVLGAIIGGIGSVFYKLLGLVEKTRIENEWIIFLLPLAGVIIVFLYRLCEKKDQLNTDLILLSVRGRKDIPILMAPLIFVSTLLTHLCGGSAGREGAALQLGGSIAQGIGKVIRLDEKDRHIITMCGMSACFAALFGTPIAAAVFALEVVSVGVMYYAALVPCAVAAVLSVWISHLFGISHSWTAVSFVAETEPLLILQVIILGILCACVSYVFCRAIGLCGKAGKKLLKNNYLRTVIGALIIIALTFALGTREYLGAGMDVISRALSGNARIEEFVLKIIFTAITLAAAFKGGEIVPTLFIGSTFGAAVAPVLGLDPAFAAMLSMIAVFCGVTNCPITALLIGIELFGIANAPFMLIICAVAYMLSGYTGLYGEQKIMYSKFKSEYINEHATH